jgi:Ca2+-binding EF-hand superfamily protein
MGAQAALKEAKKDEPDAVGGLEGTTEEAKAASRAAAAALRSCVDAEKRFYDKHHFDFVTFGVKHLTFWSFSPGGEPVLAKKDASYGTPPVGTRQDVHHACFLPSGQLLTGGSNGRLMVWEKNKAVAEIKAHRPGPLKCIRLRSEGSDQLQLLTCGGDGKVLEWEVTMLDDELEGLSNEIKTQDVEITKKQLAMVKNVTRVLEQAIREPERQLFEKPFNSRQELFSAMDRDGTPGLSEAEFQDACKRLGLGLTDDQVRLLWQLMDGDGAGTLEFDEFERIFNVEPILEKLVTSGAIEMKIRGDVHPEGVIDLDLEKDPDGPQTINCIDCSPHESFFVGADSENDIWEIDDDPRNMVEGQSGAVMGLCPHPVLSRVYATTCTDGHVGVWNAELRENVKMIRIVRGAPAGEDRDERRAFKKLHMVEDEQLQAYAVGFNGRVDGADATMMAVSSAGVVFDGTCEDCGAAEPEHGMPAENVRAASSQQPADNSVTRVPMARTRGLTQQEYSIGGCMCVRAMHCTETALVCNVRQVQAPGFRGREVRQRRDAAGLRVHAADVRKVTRCVGLAG